MKFNRFDNRKPKTPAYINVVPIFLSSSSSIFKNSLSSTLKNHTKNVESINHNPIIPELSYSSYQSNVQLSPKKQRIHNSNSASFDKYLVKLSKEKILKFLLNNKPKKRLFENKYNHVIIKSESNNEADKKGILTKDKDKEIDNNKDNNINNHPCPFNEANKMISSNNSSNKKSTSKPSLYLDYTIQEEKVGLKNQTSNRVSTIRNPFISQPKQVSVLKKENNTNRNTRNKKEGTPNNPINSFVQITKLNSFFINHQQDNTNNSNKPKIVECNLNGHIQPKEVIKLNNNNNNHPKLSESNFDIKEVDGKVNNVYTSIQAMKNKSKMLNTIPDDNMHYNKKNNKKDYYKEYHDIIWNNINSINADIANTHLNKPQSQHQQRKGNKDTNKQYFKDNNTDNVENNKHLERHHSKDTTLPLPIDCRELINETNSSLTNLLRDTIIYNEEYFNESHNNNHKPVRPSPDDSSTSNEEEEANAEGDAGNSNGEGEDNDDEEEEVIENDELVNEHGLDEEIVSDKFKTFKSLRCFSIKPTLSSLSLLESTLPYVIRYLNIKSISTLVQVNHYLNNQLAQILYNEIGNIILKGSNNNFISLIKPSIFHYSFIFNSPCISSIYHCNLRRKTQYSNAIRKDLLRTIVDDESFTVGSLNSKKLKHILTAYSNYNSKIGYAQGMNFLVANAIYLFDKEEDVFLFIDGLVNKFQLENLYGVTNTLNIMMKELGDLIEKHSPLIVTHLNTNGLNHEFFTANWVLTLFSNTMRTKYLFMSWDFVIVFGWRFFLYFCVEVIKWNEEEIIKAEVKNLSLIMKGLMKKAGFEENFAEMIQGTFNLMRLDWCSCNNSSSQVKNYKDVII